MYIINKYESPEFKLPWIIIVFLFFLGAFAFILMTSNEQNKKMIDKFKKNKENIKSYLDYNETLNDLKKENMNAYLQANYINKELLKSLSAAKHFIFMEYFIIEEGKM